MKYSRSFTTNLAGCSAVMAAGLCLMVVFGCPIPGEPIRGGGGDGNGNVNGNGAAEFGILNIQSDISFSQDVMLTILYSVPSDAAGVVGFVQLLNAPASAGGTPIGIEEIVATGLSAGPEQSFAFQTGSLRPGFYRVGVRTDAETFLSQGTLEIQGPPSPLFLEPTADVTIMAGEAVRIMADIGDPQGAAQWRLFFQPAADPQVPEGEDPTGALLGTRLTEGTGNAVDYRWDTRNLPAGTYRLGLSATDVGLTVAAAVQAGEAESIVTTYSEFTIEVQPPPSLAMTPTIAFTISNQTAFGGDEVEITFDAQTFEGETYQVTVFYLFQGEQVTIATITDPAVTSIPFATADLESGTYAIGATISDGVNPTVEVPAADRVLINVVRAEDATLSVSEPGQSIRVAQGDSVDVVWSTDVPAGRGTIDVFAREFSLDEPLGVPGTEVNIASDLSTSMSSVTWQTTDERGLFVVIVELTVPELADSLPVAASGIVRVSVSAAQFWIGSIGNGPQSLRQGEVFQGVNFQDNAGTFLNNVGDYDRDGRDDFIVGARYGKPFLQNPGGIGIGEAYLVYGGERRNQTLNLNRVALAELRGIAFTGIIPREDAQTTTDGISAIRLIPDQDGDLVPELAFGIPFVSSRGHARRLFVDRQPFARDTLEKSRQFERGGVVFVASTNTKLSAPDATFTGNPDAPIELRAVINLDLVGQNFTVTSRFSLETIEGGENGCNDLIALDNQQAEMQDDGMGGMTLVCTEDETDDEPETFVGTQRGFSPALAPHLGVLCTPFSNAAFDPPLCYDATTHLLTQIPNPVGGCAATLGLSFSAITATDIGLTGPSPLEDPDDQRLGSGFYPLSGNAVLEPFGARLIGNEVNDEFGTSIAVSGGFIIISAPQRQPDVSIEVPGFTGALPTNPGIMYLVNMNNLWPDESLWGTPPLPFQYQMGPFPEGAPSIRNSPSHCGRSALLESFPSPFRILGEDGQFIEVVEGIPDFNGDGREDFVVGAPLANGGEGAVNIVYRRDPFLEGDYILQRLSRDPLDVERLAGARINGRATNGFGEVIARSFVEVNEDGSLANRTVDFNGDGRDDLIVGNPDADNGRGEVIVVFSANNLVTPANGLDLDDLLAASDTAGNPRAVRIVGRQAGDLFGFNVAVVGDFNGDSANDILVAAPGASPAFDSDDDGTLDTAGVDVVNLLDPESEFGDGAADTIPGETDNLLTDAGEVYLILGATSTSNNLQTLVEGQADRTISIEQLGTSEFRGMVFVGARSRDALGGGRESKRDKRSFGIGPAGDVDGDGRMDILMGSILADPDGRTDAGEAYLVYGFSL